MKDAATYAKFAEECRRMAQRASENDKVLLIQIAEAWEEQAKKAEQKIKKDDR